MGYHASSLEWTKHRNDPAFAFLQETSSVPQQQALRHLQTAFVNFFAKRSGYPRFRSKFCRQSATYTASGFKWEATNRNLSISKVGRLSVVWSREFSGDPSTVTITKDFAGRYHVTLCLEETKVELPKTGDRVGIDVGVNRLATLSTGDRIANPRHTAKHAAKLTRLQRVLSRRKHGSNRWKHQKRKVARHHAHIASSRKDYLSKLTTGLVRRFDVIAIEDLNMRGMAKSHSLAKSISCAGFGMFRRMLEYKCEWYGKELRLCDRFFPSSKRCSSCGHIHEKMTLDVREFDCDGCGQHHDRDENASKNILAAGQAVTGRGGRVRPKQASACVGGARGSVNQPTLHCAQ